MAWNGRGEGVILQESGGGGGGRDIGVQDRMRNFSLFNPHNNNDNIYYDTDGPNGGS